MAIAVSILLCGRSAWAAEAQVAAHGIAIVVGRESPVKAITKDTLRELYLRRQRLWPDGAAVIPINLPPSSGVRDDFSRLVLGRSTQDMVSYWNSRFFEGLVPPQVLQSSAAIRGFLAAEPGAIAYMSVGDVDDSCRTLLVLEVPR